MLWKPASGHQACLLALGCHPRQGHGAQTDCCRYVYVQMPLCVPGWLPLTHHHEAPPHLLPLLMSPAPNGEVPAPQTCIGFSVLPSVQLGTDVGRSPCDPCGAALCTAGQCCMRPLCLRCQDRHLPQRAEVSQHRLSRDTVPHISSTLKTILIFCIPS